MNEVLCAMLIWLAFTVGCLLGWNARGKWNKEMDKEFSKAPCDTAQKDTK